MKKTLNKDNIYKVICMIQYKKHLSGQQELRQLWNELAMNTLLSWNKQTCLWEEWMTDKKH